METYDDAAFERFCSGLINEGFSPVKDTGQRRWTGPLRPSLRPLTDATRMQIVFYPGWPLRYAHVIVDGLRTEHAAHGIICLWAEDDPAQIVGRDLQALWNRLGEWAAAAQGGFRVEDRALDAYLLFDDQSSYQAELPFGDLIRAGNNGYLAPLVATKQGKRALMIKPAASPDTADGDKPGLKGAFYLRRDIGVPPRHLDDIKASLTRRQAADLHRGLSERAPTALAEPSGGYDFIVLAWPRHDREHDAVVVAFEGQGDFLKASAMSATPNDTASRQRRAGPDVELLSGKNILIAGAGSVGGHVGVSLAASGVERIRLHDSDFLKTGNLVRHVSSQHLVGYRKTLAVSMTVDDHAPWTDVDRHDDLSYSPTELSTEIEGVDLVIDCTGIFSMSAALAEVCRCTNTPLITGALFHQGAIARIQRQADGDTPIAARPTDSNYLELPSEDPTKLDTGFLELGCTAPINNAPPVAVLSTAAEIAYAAIDLLTGRRERPDERIIVLRPMDAPVRPNRDLRPATAGRVDMNAPKGSPLLVLSESAQAAMACAATSAFPNETGGILVGVHLDGQPWVARAIEIETTDRGRHHYKIPAGATQPAVRTARRADHRLGYLGDWHSHPADIGPSRTDLATLTLISMRHPRTPNPTLVVVRHPVHGHVLDARRIVAITPRVCELRLVGDLPPEGSQFD